MHGWQHGLVRLAAECHCRQHTTALHIWMGLFAWQRCIGGVSSIRHTTSGSESVYAWQLCAGPLAQNEVARLAGRVCMAGSGVHNTLLDETVHMAVRVCTAGSGVQN